MFYNAVRLHIAKSSWLARCRLSGTVLQAKIQNTEQEKTEEKITESACLNCRNVPDEESHGRYEMLNDMLMHHAMGERDAQKREMKQYYGMQMVTKEVFHIL